MNSFKEKCIELRKKDLTLNEIMQATGRSKTTVYYHIQDIPLSKQKSKMIAERAKKRMVSYSKARKGKSDKKFRRFKVWTTDTIQLISHLMFDGEICKGKCVYTNSNDVLIDKVTTQMRKIYGYEPTRRKRDGVASVGYYNVELGLYLKEKSKKLVQEVAKLDKSLQKIFLRAFFDDEGCVDFNNKTRRVRGYQHSNEILLLIKRLLENFGIESTVRKNGKEVVVSRKKNLIKFRDEINFSPGVKINGKRKNSIWKQNLEKREILENAINSYLR